MCETWQAGAVDRASLRVCCNAEQDSELFIYYLRFLFWTLRAVSYIDLFPPLWTANLDTQWRVRTLKKAQVFTPGLCSQQELRLGSDKDKIPQRQEEDFFLKATTFVTSLPEICDLRNLPDFPYYLFFSWFYTLCSAVRQGCSTKVWALHISSLTPCLLWFRLTPSQCWIVLLHRTSTGHSSLPTISAHLILSSDIANWKTEPLSSDPGTWINN